MGKNYRKELDSLSEIYRKAICCDCEIISNFINKYCQKTFLAIGSGGSFSVAKIFEYMCTISGRMSKSITPLELGHYSDQLKQNVAVLFTAGGSNNDSRNAYTYVSNYEMEGILTCCMKQNSPIKKMQKENLHNYFFEYQMPVAKDGYLAVESMISFLTILSNAFWKATRNSFFKISEDDDWLNRKIDIDILNRVLQKQSIIVLHGGITTPAAVDLESKFSETSLGNIQLVDFRNFAHGRHFWLSDREDSTGIIALVSSKEQKIAKQTLQVVPESIPIFSVDIDDSTIMGLFEAFHFIFEIVYQAGMLRGIDPGKPKVPDFGRKMYHINYSMGNKRNDVVLCAAERKKAVGMNSCMAEYFEQGKENYKRLKRNSFRGIIFDYDGTLHNKEKYTSTESAIFDRINEFLAAGIQIGIATGRGQSVRRELQKVIEEQYWKDVVIAYYNGGCIGTLDDNMQPDKKSKGFPIEFEEIKVFLETSIPKETLKVDGIKDRNPFQLTIINDNDERGKACLEVIKEFVRQKSTVKILESSHSIDIIPLKSSKNNIFSWGLWKQYNEDDFLRFGDAGHFGGNDYELLQSIYGISVDSISTSPKYCWNYAKQGMRNLEATLYYLSERLEITQDGIKWR
ncbi:MAG: HAD hydrolase family protein [Lachnospiraceae bacterium]|nr:HAD hydrolase family protein [Lachnospiraceae bacterium]